MAKASRCSGIEPKPTDFTKVDRWSSKPLEPFLRCSKHVPGLLLGLLPDRDGCRHVPVASAAA